MTEPLTKELERRKTAEKAPDVFALLERQKPAIEKMLGGVIASERFARVMTTELKRTPLLAECDPHSFLGAVMVTAQLELEPGPLGLVYLVPFKREVQVIVGYRGYVELAYRAGVRSIVARLVYEGEPYKIKGGSADKIEHEILAPGDRGDEIVAAYALAKPTGSVPVWVATWPEDWEKARKASALGAKNQGPWKDDYAAMVRKTALRRLEPWLPKTPQLGVAVAADEQPAPAIEDVPEVVDDGS